MTKNEFKTQRIRKYKFIHILFLICIIYIMRKTRNYKRKNKKNISKKNKKQKGGIGEYDDELVLIGYFTNDLLKRLPGNSNILLMLSPIHVSKSYSLETSNKEGIYTGFDRQSYPSREIRIGMNPLTAILSDFWTHSSPHNRVYYFRDMGYNFKINIEKLNLLPNLKNINIYRLLSRGLNICDRNNNELMIRDNTILELLAKYVDLKYNDLLVNTSIESINSEQHHQPKFIKNISTDEYYSKQPHYNKKNLLEDIKKEIIKYFENSSGYNNVYGPINETLFLPLKKIKNDYNDYNYILLKDAIEALERAYPSLIARVLLETDAELAGEESRNVRQSRASRIMEEGMERIKRNSKASEKNIQQEDPDFPEEEEDF